jgi:hypothetical protein
MVWEAIDPHHRIQLQLVPPCGKPFIIWGKERMNVERFKKCEESLYLKEQI